MGGSDSRQTIIQRHYVDNPQTIQLIKMLQQQCQKLQRDLDEAKKIAKDTKDPTKYKEQKQKAFEAFLTGLQKLNFKDPIQKKNPFEKHHILMGNISAGKSSMINKFFGTNLAVGLGQTTLQPSKVASNGEVNIWDSPGINDSFDIIDVQTLSYFHSADRIFILYPDSIKSCKDTVRVMAKIKPYNTYLIRTQCDRFETGMNKTVQQQLQTDRKYVRDTLKLDLPVYGTSSLKGAQFLDNSKILSLIKNP